MTNIDAAAKIIHECWTSDQVVDALTASDCPASPEEGYAVQAAMASLRGEGIRGWKIAATAQAGRQHINVDRPLAGRLYESIVFDDGARVPFENNRMAVAEAEFVFMLGADLVPQQAPYTEAQIADAIASLHPGLEFPDSRFSDFTAVGTACLVADNACARHFVLGAATKEKFDALALAEHPSELWINDAQVTSGYGRDALGGPLTALTWIANTLSGLGIPLRSGEFVTTGVTGKPSPIRQGDHVRVDLGRFGTVSATLV